MYIGGGICNLETWEELVAKRVEHMLSFRLNQGGKLCKGSGTYEILWPFLSNRDRSSVGNMDSPLSVNA